ncbi:hypothetical protein EGH22_09115 [Halomicroarcula sp. F28]|uniref:hypothetical protein n=1 Tax=Haloarcula salinisoli TaxID=2487746 RepID=UPI001C73BC64|nr:hypothetical protein [Halomicroarcula salinisoli]MBX0286486.1 hypothetical protein [Halomicroarcula salinisoli]
MGIFDVLRALFGGGQATADDGRTEPTAEDESATTPDDDGAESTDDGGFRIPENATRDERVPFGALAATNRAELHENAEEFAEFWSEYELDFTPSSIPDVDAMVATQQERANYLSIDLGDGYEGAVAPMASEPAAYFGEVMVRNYDAEWTFDEDFGWALQFGNGQIVNIFKTAHQALEGDPPFVMLHDTFVEDVGLDGDLLDTDGGRAAVMDVDEGIDPDDFDDEAIAAAAGERDAEELIEDVRGDAEDHVEAWPAYEFDYSVESLERLDELVTAEFSGPAFADAEVGSTDDEASILLTAHTVNAGSYFGEVLRRELGGSWRHTETDGLQLELPVSDGAARVSPIAMAESCLAGDDTFTDRYAGVREVLDEVGEQLESGD